MDDWPSETAHLMISALDDLRPDEQFDALVLLVEMLGESYPPRVMAVLAAKIMNDLVQRSHD